MTDELIERFFEKNCTREEAEQVMSFFRDHPEILEKYFSLKEWQQTEPVQMNSEFWDGVWKEVQQKKKRGARLLFLKKAAVAASIVLLMGVAYVKFFETKQRQPKLVAAAQEFKKDQRIILNTTADLMKISLPDSSLVSLSPGSVIVYDVPFDTNKRDISLDGKARFKVQKDEARPFTVFAGGLATTALGTEFTINTHERLNNNTTVKLHTGKVVIRHTAGNSKAFKKDIYLEPGQQLDYNESQLLVEVGSIRNESIAKVQQKLPRAVQRKKIAAVSDTLSFVNTTLSEVITRLSDYFDAKIEFDHKALDAMNFTGTVARSDSLPIVLKVIAQMNGLELIPGNGKYMLRKTSQ
jgi:ferric-dicitrate binding protein FerR (iron transport regulator)